MNDRPNPDELLSRVQAEEARARRGRLKIFFGYAAGVGKTYSMLEAARREREAGVDVVVGYVEPHGRPQTEALLSGLEAVPTREVPYRGVALREFDLDATLARRPRLAIVDELAHTNAEGSRHAKRWQDVEELLAAGIDVYSTLNVQHVESLNDVVAQVTGVVVQETLPDAVLESADEIELIDITPEELMERLGAGKVYIPQQAQRALRSFFQKSNLVALREMSLRQAAKRLRRDVDAARQDKSVSTAWATSERLLVCVGPSPTTAKIVRAAKRMADAFSADWLAVAVQRPGGTTSIDPRITQNLRLAERLGAETRILVGDKVAPAVLDYARERNVSKIVVGKTAQPWWRRSLFGAVVDVLLERSGDIDVYVIHGEAEAERPPSAPHRTASIDWRKYAAAAAISAACGLPGWLFHRLQLAEANVVMVFLLGVAVVAARFGRGPSVLASIVSVLTFNFFFVEPQFTFAVHDAPRYLFTFGVLLGIGLLIGELTSRLQQRLAASQQQERRTAALYRLTRQLSTLAGTEFLLQSAGRQLGEIFTGEVVIYLRDPGGPLSPRYGAETAIARQPQNAAVAQWVADHDQVAGLATDTLPNATALFVPLIGSRNTVGALAVRSEPPERLDDPEQRRLLETCASLIALSIERDQSLLEANEALLQVQAEQLRSSLLSSVSHDLRTPLAAIAGAGSSLLEGRPADEAGRRELLQTVVEESQRLTRLVENLLDMTRLESGAAAPHRQWQVLEEIVGSARHRMRQELRDREVRIEIPADLPLLLVDGLLLEQVLVNLLENAARYTPAGSPLEISADSDAARVVIRIADRGPGLPSGSEERIFDKFFRGTSHVPDGRRGVGLGLAICRGIVRAHGGEIRAANRSGGGAEFVVSLPRDESPPSVVLDEYLAAAAPARSAP